MATTTLDAQRINLLNAESEIRALEILIQYAQLHPVAMERLQDAIACIRGALSDYRGTLQ